MIKRLNPRQGYIPLLLCVCIGGLVGISAANPSAEGTVLWQIGKVDNDTAEFALGRGGSGRYSTKFSAGALFMMGHSDAKEDFPYIQPGPADAWAGHKSHTFTIIFALKAPPKSGDCELLIDLVDTHSSKPPKMETEVDIAVKVQGKSIAQKTLTIKPVRKWVIYMLHHTHLDIGYTHVQTEVGQMQWRFLDQAVELGAKTKDYPPEARFKWLPERLWAVDSYLRNASADKEKRFIDAVKKGYISLDALYGNELTALPRPEELLELTGYARRFAQKYHITIDSAMITDVPGYTWRSIPTSS